MPRDDLLKGRISLANHAYHITICTDQRQPVFMDFDCARIVVAEMRHCEQIGWLHSLAWVIMPDHLHWLLQITGQRSLSESIQHFKGRSAYALNRWRGQSGRVWQKGFHDHALRGDEDLRNVARYIVANPLRAGLVDKIGDYAFWDAVWF